MSIHVTDFKWEKGKNDLRYIELLEKTLKNEQAITAKAVAKIRELSKENKEIRNKTIQEFAELLCVACCENTFHATINGIKNVEMMTLDGVTETIFEVAEKMRGGAE